MNLNQETIQNFLNLPGLGGVALFNGRSRPYFHGFCQSLNSNQREALAQGVQQVIDTTPTDFQRFEFRFTEYQVFVYKLEHRMTLLVMMQPGQIYADYHSQIEKVKDIFNGAEDRAIATFQSLAAHSVPSNHPGFLTDIPTTLIQPPDLTISLQETLTVMNDLSKLATQYLGTLVVINYWKNSRPEADWLKLFQIERSAQVVFSGQTDSVFLTPEQHELLQSWVATLIKRCSKVIRDFPKMVRQMPLSDRQKAILLTKQLLSEQPPSSASSEN